MPCHVLSCACSRFIGESQAFLCPLCQREYATRASLEIHLYGQHPGLAARERSILLQGAVMLTQTGGTAPAPIPISVEARTTVRAARPETAAT